MSLSTALLIQETSSIRPYQTFSNDAELQQQNVGLRTTKCFQFTAKLFCALGCLCVFGPGAYFCWNNLCQLNDTDTTICGIIALVGGIFLTMGCYYFKPSGEQCLTMPKLRLPCTQRHSSQTEISAQ